MNEFSIAIRLRWLLVTGVAAAAAVPLSFILWRTPSGVATPTPSLLPFFVAIAVVIPALSFGFGVAFLLLGDRDHRELRRSGLLFEVRPRAASSRPARG